MNTLDVLKVVGLLLPLIGGFIYALFKFWLLKKIQYAVKNNYDRQLEDYKNTLSTRSRAALIADLMAEWLSDPDDRKHLNKLSFEAFLWLPKDIAEDLSKLLNHQPGAKSTREILATVRNHLLGEEEKIDSNNIIHFPKKKVANLASNASKS
jgi:hypothetical protein